MKVMFEVKVDNIKRFEKTYVEEFEKRSVEKGKILFIGSSGFTRWNKSSLFLLMDNKKCTPQQQNVSI